MIYYLCHVLTKHKNHSKFEIQKAVYNIFVMSHIVDDYISLALMEKKSLFTLVSEKTKVIYKKKSNV